MSDPRSLGKIDAWVPTPLTVEPTSSIFRLPGLMGGGNRASGVSLVSLMYLVVAQMRNRAWLFMAI